MSESQKKCIVVLGMHRSGTSVLTGLLSMLGGDVGSDIMPPTEDNPKGYFENNYIYHLNKKILAENQANWDSVNFDFTTIQSDQIQTYVAEARRVIENEFRYVRTVVIKDPRVCLLFPIWERALTELDIQIKVILPIRSPMEVARSLQKRDGFIIEKGFHLWASHVLLAEKYSRPYDREYIFYPQDYADPNKLALRLSGILNTSHDKELLEQSKSFFTPSLSHHNVGFENIGDVPKSLAKLVSLLQGRVFSNEKFDAVRKEYHTECLFYSLPFQNKYDEIEAKLQNERQLWTQQNDALKHKFNELAESKSILKERYQKLADSKSALAKEHQMLADSKSALAKEHQMLADSKSALAKEHQMLADSKSTLVKEHQMLVESKNKVVNTYEALVISNERLTETYQQLSKEIQSLKQKKVEKDSFILRLKSDISKLLDKIQRIEGDYHKLKHDRDTKNYLLEEKGALVSYLTSRLGNSDRLLYDLSEKKVPKRIINQLNVLKLQKRYQKKWYWPIEWKPLATHRKRIIAGSGFFSPVYYLTAYPDVRESGIAPLEHFYRYGWKEGRRPSDKFDLKAYLKAYPDVAESGINPLIHYILHGVKEGRSPTPLISSPPERSLAQKSISSIASPPLAKQQVPKAATVSKSSGAIPSTDFSPLATGGYGPVIARDWGRKVSFIRELDGNFNKPQKSMPEALIEKIKSQLSIKHQPLVSVIMPSWNRGGVIGDAIDSVLQQSYSNVELILSDDGSTDNTLAFIEANYSDAIASGKLKLLRNPHQGVCPTRNAGLRVAKGELVAYLDSDNQWREHYLLFMVAAFVENDELNCAYSALLVHDHNKNIKRILSTSYNRKQLLTSNFIDMNAFVHRASLYQQYGGFDESLTRLVDWELIIRYTRHYEPAHLPFVGVDYYLDHDKFSNITTTVGLDENRESINKKHLLERFRYRLDVPRLAYVLWDYPALSQTFVINELRWLVENNYDVKVYYAADPDKAATLDFEVESYRTETPEKLIPLLREHNRNYCHSHFAYPAVTKLTWPACSELKLPFTFMPHAVDIFHHENQRRNCIGEISQSFLCKKIFVHGHYHKTFLEGQNVPSEKMAYNFQAVNLNEFLIPTDKPIEADEGTTDQSLSTGIVLSRFVEKKGISSLIDAAVLLQDESVCFEIYGYGPLESEYKEQIEKRRLTNVKLMGVLQSKDQVRDLYARGGFLIAPCVEAKNGDRDGFPTVILEAFSMDVPVITTDIAAIPDYLSDRVHALIAPAGDAKALADKVRQLLRMPVNRVEALTYQAKHFLQTKVGTHLSMSLLTDVWLDKRIDIFLVAFNNEQYDDEAETLEIIRRIFAYTTTPFTLTIVDNHSDESFWLNILKHVEGRDNVRLIRKEQNLMCGPSSNIALEMGDGEFAIYICAKEGFIAKHGWERTLLNAMREKPNAALGGHHVHMPKYVYGREYETHPEFSKYRNQEYLVGRLDRPFTHIQGGVFIIRREVFAEHGGFNPLIPHGGMDVELSFYYESLGYKLLEIPEIASLTVKTRPTLTAVVDEDTAIAHPLNVESVGDRLDSVVNKLTKQCNVCGWQGKKFGKYEGCPKCKSTPEGRLIYKFIASNYRIYRGEKALFVGKDLGLSIALKSLFSLSSSESVPEVMSGALSAMSVVFVQDAAMAGQPELHRLYASLDENGLLLVVDDGTIDYSNISANKVSYARRSQVNGFTWKSLTLIEK